MDIPILLEPTPTGWRASTGAPLNLTAEGPNRDAVLADVRAQSAAKLTSGATIVPLSVPSPTLDIDALEKLAAEMSASPFFDEWVRGIAEYRAEVNVPPDVDDESNVPVMPMAPRSVGEANDISPVTGS